MNFPATNTLPWSPQQFDITIKFFTADTFYFCPWSPALGSICHFWNIYTQEWGQTTSGPSAIHRYNPIIVMDDGRVILSGGQLPPHDVNDMMYPNGTWTQIVAMPTVWRSHSGCAISESKFITASGFDIGGATKKSYIFDLDTNSYERIADTIEISDDGGCLKMDDNRVITAGGWTSALVQVYDITNDQWTVRTDWVLPNNAAGGLLQKMWNGKILFFGGYHLWSTRVLELDEQTGWIVKPNMPQEAALNYEKKIIPFPNNKYFEYQAPSCNN